MLVLLFASVDAAADNEMKVEMCKAGMEQYLDDQRSDLIEFHYMKKLGRDRRTAELAVSYLGGLFDYLCENEKYEALDISIKSLGLSVVDQMTLELKKNNS